MPQLRGLMLSSTVHDTPAIGYLHSSSAWKITLDAFADSSSDKSSSDKSSSDKSSSNMRGISRDVRVLELLASLSRTNLGELSSREQSINRLF